MRHAAKFQFDVELLRRGCNQLGVLAIAAGLVAFFIEPIPGPGEVYLIAIGAGFYFISSLNPATNYGQSSGGNNAD